MERPMPRRDFLAAAAAGVLAAAGGCAGVAAHPVPVTDGRIRLRPDEHPALAAGGVLKVRPGSRAEPVYVVASGDGYLALSPVCSHLGCTVDVEGRRFVCPCHGSTYDREGRVVRGPAERALTRHPARLAADGTLEIVVGPEVGR